jgi:predicted GNAT family N-acyltransferase
MNTHLGTESSLSFHQADAEITAKQNYTVVRTPGRPHFFWGNFLIFHSVPNEANHTTWMENYRSEFNVDEQGFISITWNDSAIGNITQFLNNGFEIETQEVLRLESLTAPQAMNPSVKVRIIESENDWLQVKDTQWIKDWPLKQSQDEFVKNKILAYRRLQDQGFGYRFGAFIDSKLVGDLGLYSRNGIARFNNVCTHSTLYNQGICRTLVYGSLKIAMERKLAKEFVMQATETEYSKNIYKKIGFEVCGKSHDLTWMSDRWKVEK